MKYFLSKIVPMHFQTNYVSDGRLFHVKWMQWADRAFAVREQSVAI